MSCSKCAADPLVSCHGRNLQKTWLQETMGIHQGRNDYQIVIYDTCYYLKIRYLMSISDMPYIETTFEVKKQKLKLKDVIHSIFNYYYQHININ